MQISQKLDFWNQKHFYWKYQFQINNITLNSTLKFGIIITDAPDDGRCMNALNNNKEWNFNCTIKIVGIQDFTNWLFSSNYIIKIANVDRLFHNSFTVENMCYIMYSYCEFQKIDSEEKLTFMLISNFKNSLVIKGENFDMLFFYKITSR